VWLGDAVSAEERHLETGSQAIDASGGRAESLTLLETNIDDMNPQVYGYLFERLLGSGALDVFCTSIAMKKNRPGTMLSVLCRSEDAVRFQGLLLHETTTMGVRVQPVWRVAAERTTCMVETPYGLVRAKLKWLEGRAVAASPEYEDCAALAREHGRPLIEVLALARRSAEELMEHSTRLERG
jgi:uncharacterized protein (DUF111 family)